MDSSDLPNDAGNFFKRLLNFDSLIGGSLVKIIYFLGLFGIVIWTVVALLASVTAMRYDVGSGLGALVLALVGLVFGTLIWRFMCEIYVIMFNIHDRLGEIRDRLPPR